MTDTEALIATLKQDVADNVARFAREMGQIIPPYVKAEFDRKLEHLRIGTGMDIAARLSGCLLYRPGDTEH